MSALLAGLLGGLGAYFLVRHVSRRIKTGDGDGTLEFAPFLNRLGWIALLGSAYLAYALFFKQTAALTVMQWAWLLALAGSAVFCLCEGNITRGRFDDAGIRFTTAWGGTRNELWRDLRSVRYSSTLACYILKFKSGKTIRLSVLLGGHGGVLARVRAWGHHV